MNIWDFALAKAGSYIYSSKKVKKRLNKTKQNKTKQNKTKQNKTKQKQKKYLQEVWRIREKGEGEGIPETL